jgi:hypothetical protein
MFDNKQLKYKVERVQVLKEQHPRLLVEEKEREMYDLLLEIDELEEELEEVDCRTKYMNLCRDIQQKETQVCMLENEIRQIAHQMDDGEEIEFISGDDL